MANVGKRKAFSIGTEKHAVNAFSQNEIEHFECCDDDVITSGECYRTLELYGFLLAYASLQHDLTEDMTLACPKGTYKSKLEPAKQCTPCPAGSTTTREASTSLKDCFCKEGYEGNPLTGLPCTLKKCPPLQKPTNGFVLGDCEDSEKAFGSECHFLCEEGFELVDKENDIRTCLANGSWSGKNAVCRRIHCTKPPQPSFGRISCDKGDLLVGAKCRLSCLPGFIMEGSQERECLSSQRWSGTDAKCT
ncbi:Sushi, von Willebrand factor type A, EGF and pentraxin domain-containing protein 1, partial [Araneus ventricosus]